ncbi:sulfite exporter TauE/SafE family protein [Sulfitobacter alexandrii]|uniref:sulfite exporter TauE/SafE family protein n=1 Tax=Sulfitobacter alexandrii TaxID=1917485 RepID=UPI001F3B740E|nr:sulfite exporter TauE/SafE family protein [Sulfitobacter alexandrii]
MPDLWSALPLSPTDTVLLFAIVLAAGLVRGFAGFALSALVMAAAASFIAPVLLIPILWFQEMAASLLMARGGWREANRLRAGLLVAGNWAGWPLGLWLTVSLPATTSARIALVLILVLAALQLLRVNIPALATRWGTLMAGVVAGIASGVAHVGGMVVALYVLSQNDTARSMRGTLVLYLFLGSLGSLVYLLGFGVMTPAAAKGALFLLPVTLLGVWLGSKLFNPRWEPYYKPFCLSLLIGLAALSLIRSLI